MKKLLLFAGSLAVMVSCQKTETTPDAPQAPESKGLVFVVDNGVDTKAQYEGLNTNWTAEQDRLGIFFMNAGKGITAPTWAVPTAETGKDMWNWNATATPPAEIKPAVYKATTSGPRGYFTAISDDEMLTWSTTPGTKSTFAIYYPQSTATTITATGPLEFAIPVMNAQTQTDPKGASIVGLNVMVQITEPLAKVGTGSVGEAIPLQPKRQFTVIPLKIKNAAPYGALKSITMTSEVEISTSTAGTFDFKKVTKDADGKYDYSKGFTHGTKTNKITLTTANANVDGAWDESGTAYITALPVSRKAFRDGGTKDKVEIVYEFDAATFAIDWEIDMDWKANDFATISAPVLDCATVPVFFGNGTPTPNSVYINEPAGAVKLEKWITGTQFKIGDVTVPLANITELYSTNTQLDLAGLSKFTKLENLQLANTTVTAAQLAGSVATLTTVGLINATEIPSKAFKGAVALTVLAAPKVTTIADDAFSGLTAGITDLHLCSYKFDSKAVREQLLTATLTNLDLSGVDEITKELNVELVNAKTTLEEVMVKDGLKLAAETFNGFAALEAVVLHYDIEDPNAKVVDAAVELMGKDVFKGALLLPSVKLVNTEVPEGSFDGCVALEEVAFVTAPTKIGKKAFTKTIIKDIDLSAATTISASAFLECEKLVGKLDKGLNVNVLNVEKLEVLSDDTFKGCKALTHVKFPAVTKVGNDFLAVTPALKQVTFNEVFAFVKQAAAFTATSFGTAANVTLTVNPAQPKVDGVKITIGELPITFQDIVKK